MNNNLGLMLRERRKEKGLTLVELGRLSGLNHAHIGRIEKGERFPTGRTLQKLAKPLGFSELELCKLAGFISQDADEEMETPKIKCPHCGNLNPMDVTRCIYCRGNARR